MQAQLLKYCDKCFIALTNNHFDVGESCSFESIHKLRLTIKKLYTLFRILDYLEEIPAVKNDLKLIDQIFTKSGLLRDNQIHIVRLQSYQGIIGVEVNYFIERFKINIKKHKESLRRKIKRINPFDLVLLNQRLDNAIEELDSLLIEKILQTKTNDLFNKIKEIINSTPNEKELHRLRILLKELIYTLSIIKKKKVKSELNQSIIIYLKNLQIKLGEWHDLKVLYDDIKVLNIESANLLMAIEDDKKIKLVDVINELQKFEVMYLKS